MKRPPSAAALLFAIVVASPARADIIGPAIEACMDKKVGDPCVDPGFGFGGDIKRSGYCVRSHDDRRNFDFFTCDTHSLKPPAPDPTAQNAFAPAPPASATASPSSAPSSSSAPPPPAASATSPGLETTAEPPGAVPPRAGCGCSLPGVGPGVTVLGGLVFALGILLGRRAGSAGAARRNSTPPRK